MEQVVLDATRRETTGKGAARQMRRAGMIPGVVYGLGKEAVAISVVREAVEHALARHRGANVLFNLRIDGAQPAAETAALVKSMQRHPISRAPESVDLQWVSLAEKVTVMVAVKLEGAISNLAQGGVVDQVLHEVEVRCMPLVIPDQLAISIEGMNFHETRTVAAIVVPPDVEILTAPEDPVVSCTPSSKAESARDEQEGAAEGELTEVAEQ